MNHFMALEKKYAAKNYDPFPLVISKGKGIHLWDDSGKRYIDLMSAYSVTSCGHSHPRLVDKLIQQAGELAVVSRSYYSNTLGDFLRHACELLGQDTALPMNTGVEAVETAIKAARKWAYQVKGVPINQAQIITCQGNYHGRTLGAISMSTNAQTKEGFGPLPEGMITIPFGDSVTLSKAITPNTAAFLVEPIQGAGGVIVPPKGYLKECANICRQHNVLLLCDEIQVGLGRTGKWLACQHDDVVPDGIMIGKALGGGLLPVSLFMAKKELMDVFTPGDHGSTFGGNPLAAAIGLETLKVLQEENLIEQAAYLGAHLFNRLQALPMHFIKEIRGQGLFYAIEFDTNKISGEALCFNLMERGVLARFHHNFILLAPPFVIKKEELDWAIDQLKIVLTQMETASTHLLKDDK